MKKNKIMLCCSAGMSTSILVKNMQKEAELKGLDYEIFAVPISEADNELEKGGIAAILLGPQVAFAKNEFEKKGKAYNIPVSVIDMTDYGMMNGKNVFNSVIENI